MSEPFNPIVFPFHFIADFRDKSIHALDCSQVTAIMEGGQYQFYEKLEDAQEAGYRPAVCVKMKGSCDEKDSD